MREKKQNQKKLSLEKLQMAKINNTQKIKGGNKVNTSYGIDDSSKGDTGTIPTSR